MRPVVIPGAAVLTVPVGPLASVGGAFPKFGTPSVSKVVELEVPVSAYTVVVPDPWLETQMGLVVENETPQGFIKFGSVTGAMPELLATRFVCSY